MMDMSMEDPTAESVKPVTVRKKEPSVFKVIVIGDSGVGKTCLTYRFCEGRFPSKVESTIGVDFREKTLEIGEDQIKLQLWDTAGQERFRQSMVQHYYRNVHAVVYVYDVTNRASFTDLEHWLAEYESHSFSNKVPRLLVGNKCDLCHAVQVSTNEAQCFADQHGMPLFETSVKSDELTDHVESIFLTLAHKLKESKPMMGAKYTLSSCLETPPIKATKTRVRESPDQCQC